MHVVLVVKYLPMDFLKQLLQINTKSGNLAGIEQAFELLEKEYSDLEGTFSRENGGLIFAAKIFDDSKKRIVLSGHIDTVLPAQDIPVRLDDGKLFGSGAHDMKSSVYMIFEILRKLNASKQLKNITVLISPEEEIASQNFRKTIQKYSLNNDVALVFEPTLISEDLNQRSLVLARRGIQLYSLKIESEGGHSGVISKKDERFDSNIKMSEFINFVESKADYEKMTTFNPGLISGGKAFNIISPICELAFEVRFKFNEEKDRMDKVIQEFVDSLDANYRANLVRGLSFPALNENVETKNFKSIFFEKAKYQDIELVEEYRGGGSEASLFYSYNNKLVVIDGLGAKGKGEHTTSEFVYIESIQRGIDYIEEVIRSVVL